MHTHTHTHTHGTGRTGLTHTETLSDSKARGLHGSTPPPHPIPHTHREWDYVGLSGRTYNVLIRVSVATHTYITAERHHSKVPKQQNTGEKTGELSLVPKSRSKILSQRDLYSLKIVCLNKINTHAHRHCFRIRRSRQFM